MANKIPVSRSDERHAFAFALHDVARDRTLLARDRLGFSVAFGLALMIALQAAVNIAVVTSLIPPKGISLPFISFGGSSMLVNAVAIGLLASVATDARSPEEAMA